MARQKKYQYEFVPALNRYRFRMKDSDGKRVAIYGKTPEELEAKIAEAQRLIDEGRYRAENPTVREYAEGWLDRYSAHVRTTTMTDYRSIVKIYIIETMGDYLMAEVTPDIINQTAIAKAAKMSSTVFDKVVMLLKMIFQAAVDSHVIDHNPAEKINSRGGKPAGEKIALSKDQVDTLLAAVRNTPAYPFCMIALNTGMRREEILALQWDCIHLDALAPYLEVRRTWHIEHNRPVVEDQTKTKAGKRNIPIPPRLVSCLKELHEKKPDSVYVISNSDGGPLSGSQWRNVWHSTEKRTTKERTYKRRLPNGELVIHTVTPELGKASKHNPDCICMIDFPVTPHILRHTYITNLVLQGMDLKTVQYLAGHEHVTITLDVYSHLISNRPEDLAAQLDSFFRD